LVLYRNDQFLASVVSGSLVDLANADRAAERMTPLKQNRLLSRAAQLKAEDMARRGYFSHKSPEGLDPWVWFKKVGYNFLYAGENLAVNFYDSSDVQRAWMNSPTHRENILKNEYTEIGIGIAKGFYNGRETVFVVQFFGKPFSLRDLYSSTGGVPALVEGSNRLPNVAAVGSLSTAAVYYSSFFDRLVSSPRAVANTIYIILSIIVTIALLLKVFVKVKVQHPDLIANGLLLLIILGSLIIMNQYLSDGRGEIADSIGAATVRT
ncbi:MAG: CAP domain-containing protein, partial [bacterium]